jgi:hypothetical protein
LLGGKAGLDPDATFLEVLPVFVQQLLCYDIPNVEILSCVFYYCFLLDTHGLYAKIEKQVVRVDRESEAIRGDLSEGLPKIRLRQQTRARIVSVQGFHAAENWKKEVMLVHNKERRCYVRFWKPL